MRKALVVALGVHASAAFAAEYGGETQAVTADELAALAAAGELDAEGLDALLSLHDDPPDVARATPEELGLLPGVGRAEARQRIEEHDLAGPVRPSIVRLDSGAVAQHHVSPQGFARLRLSPTGYLSGSVLALARERTRFETRGGLLVSDGPRREIGLERWYAAASLGAFRLVVGTFNCSFAESLTFSSARRLYAPKLQPADAVLRAAGARSLAAAAALRGVAAQVETDAVEATAFASYRSLSLYQYGEWQRDGESPSIVVRGSGEPLRYATLADAAVETVAGGNVDVRFGEQALGVTAYVGSARLSDPEGVWSASSVYPAGPQFGAVGLHAIAQVGPVRSRLEAARTHTGGLGAVARVDVTLARDCDVGLAGRYYGVSFDNPFTRSVAAPDQMEGARARNERGLELSTTLAFGSLLRLAAAVDLWTALTAPNLVNGRARARTTWRVTAREALVLEGECVDKDLAYTGVYAGPSCVDFSDACARGARASGTARIVTERIWRSRVAVGVRHARQDIDGGVGSESRVTAHLTVRPTERFSAGVLASQRFTPRSPEIDGAKRLLAFTTATRILDWATFELMFRAEQRWDPTRESEPTTLAGALTLGVQL